MGEDLGYPAFKAKDNCVLDEMVSGWGVVRVYLFNFEFREFGDDFSERSNLS